MATYRYRRTYLHRYHGSTIPRPVLIGVAAGIALAAAGGAAPHLGHHHAQPQIHAAGGGNVALGQDLAATYGWTAANGQWQCLDTLWTGESNWSQYADTRATGLDAPDAVVFAYGVAQARPYWKMPRAAWPASLGGHSSPRTQIRWGLGYIQSAYGNPCSALAAKRASGNRGY